MWVDFDVRRQQEMDFFNGGSIIMHYWSDGLKLFLDDNDNLFLTNMQLFTSQDIIWWIRVMWITCGLLWYFLWITHLWVTFLWITSHYCDGPVDYCSCLDSHSDGTHSGSTKYFCTKLSECSSFFLKALTLMAEIQPHCLELQVWMTSLISVATFKS